MMITRHLRVPTGDILVVQGDKGNLEMLSLGDYGKDHNIKADFLGINREISKVEHTKLLPLSEKWVITISTQYGCSMSCPYCDVPKVGPGSNATFQDLRGQIVTGMNLHPEVSHTKRLNIHFARMGEPTWNPHVLTVTEYLRAMAVDVGVIHPVVSTMMPRHNPWLKAFIRNWMWLKNDAFRGEAGLQLSINSTNEAERKIAFNGQACGFADIRAIMDGLIPVGRKITLNFAVAGYEIDPVILLRYFDPAHYVIKLTPMHKTKTALENSIRTDGDYTTGEPYKEIEQKLKDAGYDVLVFVASEYEDLGRITCGNAILSGSLPECPYETIIPKSSN